MSQLAAQECHVRLERRGGQRTYGIGQVLHPLRIRPLLLENYQVLAILNLQPHVGASFAASPPTEED
jgi:hypothetical protein